MPGAEAPRIVLDASVAIRWVVEEAGSDPARAMLAQPVEWTAPRLFLTETASALRRKVVEESIEPTAASDSVAFFLDVVRTGSLRLAEDELLVDKALRLSLLLGHKLPDCVYLALAEREGIALATADQALARLAASRGVPLRLVPSA
jgi:predicted nucleic acid-binding protein